MAKLYPTFNLGYLADGAAHRPRRRVDHNSLPDLGLAQLQEPEVGGVAVGVGNFFSEGCNIDILMLAQDEVFILQG